jgi:mono/diheme cytochrome c family protein
MKDTGVPPPEESGAGAKSDQQIFDEQIAHGTGNAVLIVAGLAILAALVMSTAALVQSGERPTTTVTVAAAQVGAPGSADGGPSRLTGGALGKQLFVSGDPSVSAIGCGSCHTMKAAGTTGNLGPNLDKELSADPASATRESIVDPNKEIATGYRANIMPINYGTALTKTQLDALVRYVYDSTNTNAKQAAATTPTSP